MSSHRQLHVKELSGNILKMKVDKEILNQVLIFIII